MVTIPYSRIIRLARVRYVTVKVLWWLLAAMVFAFSGWAVWEPRDLMGTVYYLTLSGVLILLMGFVVHRIFRSRHGLTFRRADGKRCMVSFCLTSAKRRRQFVDALRGNRDTVRTLGSAASVLPALLPTEAIGKGGRG